jgi:hypothetical protein
MTRYTIDDLLGAYRRAVGRPMYGLDAYRAWDPHVLRSMCRCFGVSFEGEIAGPLRSLLEHEAGLPHPLAGYLEATLLVMRFGAVLSNLDARYAELKAFYADHARVLADRLWGNLGERTTEQLREAGWDPAREPKLEDYIDQI